MNRKKKQMNVSMATLLEREQRDRSVATKSKETDGKVTKRENVFKRVLSAML